MGNISVIGSMNMDLVVTIDTYPQKGETILGEKFKMLPGGKGANQAVTIGKLGGGVSLISACGDDQYGEILLNNLKVNNVNIEKIQKINNCNTGIASIVVEADGDNRIIVVPGAYGRLSPEMIDRVSDSIREAEVVLVQMEIPYETVLYTIDLAHELGTKVILDPAPAKPLPEETYQKIDYILPNDGELDLILADNNMKTRREKIDKLLNLGIGSVIVTEGSKGVSFYSKGVEEKYQSFNVKAVDTTGAGDAFAGAFAYGLDKEWDIEKVIKFASKVAALSVTRIGAQSSLPFLDDVVNFRG